MIFLEMKVWNIIEYSLNTLNGKFEYIEWKFEYKWIYGCKYIEYMPTLEWLESNYPRGEPSIDWI